VKLGLSLAGLLGIVAAVGIVVYNGADLVIEALISQGWGLAVVVAFHLVPLVLSAAAWQVVTGPEWRGHWSIFLWARVLREAVNDLVPGGQVGGPFAGARALILHGAPWTPATAALVVDQTSETVALVVFALIGLVMLALVGNAPNTVRWGLVGVAVATVLVGGFVVAQRFGVINLLDRAISLLVGHWNAEARPPVGDLHDTVWRVYRRAPRLAAGLVLHVICWVVGTGEVWLALRFLGHDVSWETALIVESLGQAIRSAAFVVPGALGVQEGGYVLLGAAFGIDPQTSLALSLTKRVRDIVIGAPALLAWQLVEGQRLLGGMRPRERVGEAE